MRVKRNSALALACLLCVWPHADPARVSGGQVPAATPPTEVGERVLQPSELFRDFPRLAWGMKFQDAWGALEKGGARPVRGFRDAETEIRWEGTFGGMRGRGGAHFREGAGLDEIVVGVYAFERQRAVFEEWLKKLTERHGAPAESQDTSILVSKVWRLKGGFAVELRSLKDSESPVVDIHWVRE